MSAILVMKETEWIVMKLIFVRRTEEGAIRMLYVKRSRQVEGPVRVLQDGLGMVFIVLLLTIASCHHVGFVINMPGAFSSVLQRAPANVFVVTKVMEQFARR